MILRFTEFKTAFRGSIERANDMLLKNFLINFVENSSEDIMNHENDSKSVITFTNDFESLSMENSMNQVIIIN